MENNRNLLTKSIAILMTVIMVFSMGITPAFAQEGGEDEYIAAVGETGFEALQQAVNAAENGDTVTLLGNANGDGIVVPEGKEITFDFGGFTYTIDGKLVGSAGTETLGLQLLKGARVTLRNGTLKAGKNVKFLVQNYSDLTVENMTLDVKGVDYQYAYALSNNCGNITVKGETDILSDYVAFDLWYNLIGAYPEGVKVTFDESFTGTVEGDIEYGAYAEAEGWTEKTALVIKGGTFLGEIKKSSAFESKANITVYGGTFSDGEVADYCAEYYKTEADGDNYKVVPDYVASNEKGDKFFTLQQAVNAAENGDTVTLLGNANGDGIVVPEGKEITFDFGGFTYTVDGELVGSEGTKTLGLQLLKGARVTLRNGTLKAGKNVKFLVQNYSDLTVENMTLDVKGVDYQYAYALSNNCGNITVKGETDILSDYVAFDLWYNLIGAYPEGVKVTFDESFTGTVEGDIEYGAYAEAEGWTEKTALVIKGGTFLGEIKKSSAFESKANITVYGGTFSDGEVADYCAEYYKTEADGDNYKVVPDYVASNEKGDKFFTLQQAVNAAENGDTVTLLGNANGDGIVVPEGKEITFDFGGFTYTVDGELVGSEGTKTLGLQLLKGARVTLRNGTLKAGKNVKFLVQNYSDLTVENMTLDVKGVDYQYAYALSNNCGNITVKGETDILSDYVAFDLWYNLLGAYPEGVKVTFDESFTGTVEGDIEYGADAESEGWTEKTALVIKGGTFLGEIKKSSAFESKANITVYGGTFSDGEVADYCAEDFKAVADGENYKVVPKDYIVSLGNGKRFEKIRDAVDNAADGDTVTLLGNANGDGIVVPEGKEITFDFGGFTYTVDGELVGSEGTKTLGLQLLKCARVTLRNGTLKAGKNVKFLVQNYSDLTVENMTLDVKGVDYQYAYALSNNCGNITVKGETDILSDYVAFDLWYNLLGAYPEGVKVTFDESFTGTVEGDIEYGAYAESEGWTEKTALVIKGGTFKGKIKNLAENTLYKGDMNITLYGGLFAEPVMAEWCAEGSDPAAFNDGAYGPCFHDFTEKIEDKAHFRAEASCEKGNVYYYDCSRCNKMGGETFDDGAKLGHSFSSYIYNNDGSCVKEGTATAVCDTEGCNGTHTVVISGSAKHGWGEWTVTKDASCTVNGEEERICDLCGERETKVIAAKHSYSNTFVTDVQPSCGKKGSKSRHCVYCDAKTDVTAIAAKVHSYKVTVTPATLKKDGSKKTACTLCGKAVTEKIYRIKTVKLSKTSYAYTGKYLKPAVTVKDYKGKTLVSGKDYTVKYSSNKAMGTGKVTVTFKGNYSGTKTLTFSIVPAKVSSLKLTAKNNAMELNWSTVKGAQGYQIICSTDKNFKKDKKTVTIKKQSTKKTTVKKLKDGKKYYVKIRAYRKVNGKNIYGAYSSVKNVRVK